MSQLKEEVSVEMFEGLKHTSLFQLWQKKFYMTGPGGQ